MNDPLEDPLLRWAGEICAAWVKDEWRMTVWRELRRMLAAAECDALKNHAMVLQNYVSYDTYRSLVLERFGVEKDPPPEWPIYDFEREAKT